MNANPALDHFTSQDLNLELLCRAITKTNAAISRAEQTLRALNIKRAAQEMELIRQSRRITKTESTINHQLP